MKKRFTFLGVALVLLAFLAFPLGMRGQTTTVSYGWETTDDADPWTISESITATQGEGNTGSYAGKINTNSTTVQFNEKVYVTSFSYAFKRTSTNNNYSVYIETSTDGQTWSIKDTQAMNTFTNGSYRTVTKEFDGSQELYVRFRCNNTTAVRYVDDVTITYSSSATQLDPCDLTLTNASTSLVFDLYNNSDAYVINYTTSSTGEVTVEDSNFITTVVNQTNKTITVTPVAVTNGAKVITVNQAADGNYAAGSKTFTINITDSTPATGGDVTFDATVDKDLSNTTAGQGSITKTGVTFTCSNGILGNGEEYRLYKYSVTTFSVSEGSITQIAFTGTSNNPASGFATQTGWTTEENNGTWTGNAQEVSFTASSAQVRATLIVVTVDLNSTPDPVISAENVTLDYDGTSGVIEYTITNGVNNGVLTATTSANWITVGTVGSASVPFTCLANQNATAREGIITLTYTYGDNQTVTKDVTVTQAGAPVAFTTIPELFAAATTTETDVFVTFNNWVVSGIYSNGRNVFVTDNNGNGFVIFDTNGGLDQTYTVGNVLSGTAVSCTLKKFNGFAELLNVNAADLTITTGGTVTEQNIALADLAGVNTGALVHYEGLVCSIDNSGNTPKYYLTDGTTNLQVYNSIFAFNTLENGKTYNITGIYQQFNQTKEILPRSAADIEETVVAPTYATLPFEFDGGKAAIETTDGLYQKGLGSDYNSSPKLKFDNQNDYLLLQFQETPGKLSFSIKGNGFSGGTFSVQTSEDGETFTDLATYTTLGSTQNEVFNNLGENVRYIKWVYTVRSSGNVALGNIKLLQPTQPYELTVEPVENLEIFTFVNDENEMALEGAGTIQVYEGDHVMLSVSPDPGFEIQSLMVDGQEHVNDIDDSMVYLFDMPGHNITINATAAAVVPFQPATYSLATTIESGKTYIIVGSRTSGEVTTYYAMGEQRSNNRGGYEISVEGTTATVNTEDVHEVVITAIDTLDGFYSIYDGGYLFAATTGSNYMRTKDQLDVNGQWEISIDDGDFSIVASGSSNRNVMQFNYNNSNPIFSCYASDTQSPVYLYVKDEGSTTVTQTISLKAGWNWVNLYVEGDPIDMLDALKAALGDNALQIQGKNEITEFDGEDWFGDLDNTGITNDVTYLIEIADGTPTFQIELNGTPANVNAYSITINKGWNWIGFPCATPMDVADAMNGFNAEEGDMIQSQKGTTEFDGDDWFGDLDTFEPGDGLMYFSNSDSTKTLIFNTAKKNK